MKATNFARHFSLIADQRESGKVRHNLVEVLFIAVAAFIANCNNWSDVTIWAHSKKEWLSQYLDMPNGVPSASTFQRVFRLINPKQFEKCFVEWTREIVGELRGQTVSIDGKTVRGAKEGTQERSPIHIVSAWASGNGLTLGEVKTNEKSNEITAIPELLDLLVIDGAVVTMDAMGTQTEIVRQIVDEKHADYALALKGNQQTMYRDAVLLFTGVDLDRNDADESERKMHESAAEIHAKYIQAETGMHTAGYAFESLDFQTAWTREKGHGRGESRVYLLVRDVSWMSRCEEWAGLKSLGAVISKTVNVKTGLESIDCRYYISTLEDVDKFARSVRSHWGIEAMHWTLDVTFGEDKSRARKENEAENLAMVRKMALNFHKQERKRNPGNMTYSGRRLLASLDDKFLEKVMIDGVLR